MKIFSASQIRDCDQYTIQTEPVSSVNLMERAANACAVWLANHAKNNESFYIFCGNGNNGGDGFAIARMLYQKGFDVDVFIDKNNDHLSKDAAVNFQKVKEISGIQVHDFDDVYNLVFPQNLTVVDAIFGSGLNRKPEGKTEYIIQFLNSKSVQRIAVDIPSGLPVDGIFEADSVVFQADHTLSFQFWKKSFLHPETGIFCGNIHILDIGLSGEYIHQTSVSDFVICEKLIRTIYQPRSSFSHKGNFGKSCIIAGSFGKIGAAVLAVQAALRAGSGITYALAPKCGYEILQISCPEAMYLYGGEDFIQYFDVKDDYTIGIGPGLGQDPETEDSFLSFLQNFDKPMVLDADALNIISKNSEYLDLIPPKSVITPHPKEFERFFGPTENSFERLKLAQMKAAKYELIIVLKDHRTQIITPEGSVYYNITGNPGMAKGGSGDVLTGIITSLISQNYSPEEAAVFGVWLHGKAGDMAAERHSEEAMLAGNIIDQLGNVFRLLN